MNILHKNTIEFLILYSSLTVHIKNWENNEKQFKSDCLDLHFSSVDELQTRKFEFSGYFNAHVTPHVAAKPSIPLRLGTNLKVDFFESLDPPR